MRAVVIGAVLAAGTVAGAQDAGVTDAGSTAPAPQVHRLTAAVAAGQHVRLDTDHGAVHVWVPAGYHPDGGATIVYVHGYYTDVDHAWQNYQLPEQFALSGLDAVFIACE